MIEVKNEALKQVEPLLKSVPVEVKKAMTRAVNLGTTKSRTIAVKQATTDYFITAKSIREAIKISKATYQTPQASMLVRGSRLSLIRFKSVGKAGPSKYWHPRLRIGENKSDGIVERTNRFYQYGRNGIMHIFYRTGRMKQKEEKKTGKKRTVSETDVSRGLSVPQMLGTVKALDYLEEQAIPVVEKEFDRQIHHLLRGGKWHTQSLKMIWKKDLKSV